jgi:hypothetical protein
LIWKNTILSAYFQHIANGETMDNCLDKCLDLCLVVAGSAASNADDKRYREKKIPVLS